MKKYLSLVFQVLMLSNMIAQYSPARPYEKIKFESIEPIYQTPFYDPNFRDLGSDGYNCFADLGTVEPLVYKNYIFTVHYNYISSPGYLGSYYLTCTNLDDGRTVWRNKLNNDNITNIELPRMMEINDNNELVVIGHKKKSPYDGKQYVSDGLIFKRTYDIDTGNLIGLYHRNFEDTLAYDTEFVLFNASLFFRDNNSNLRIVERISADGNVGFKSYLLDETGKIIGKPDTILYSYFDDFVNNVNIAKIGEDSLVMIEIGLDDINAFIILRYLTYDLKVLHEVKIISPVIDNLPYIKLMDVAQAQNLLHLSIWQYDSNTRTQYNLNLVLNESGDILKKVSLPLDYAVLSWDNDRSILSNNVSFNYSNNPSQHNLVQFRSCESDSNCTLLKEHKVTDPLRFAFVTKYFEYDDKEIVLLNEGSLKFRSSGFNEIDDFAMAKSIMAFKKGDFLPASLLSNLNYIGNENIVTIKTYPNPSSGPLTLDIKGIIGQVDVRVFDLLGRNVYVQDSIAEGETILDLSGLAAGNYFYKIYQGNKEISSGQWVKML